MVTLMQLRQPKNVIKVTQVFLQCIASYFVFVSPVQPTSFHFSPVQSSSVQSSPVQSSPVQSSVHSFHTFFVMVKTPSTIVILVACLFFMWHINSHHWGFYCASTKSLSTEIAQGKIFALINWTYGDTGFKFTVTMQTSYESTYIR